MAVLAGTSVQVAYAGFWKRFVAYIIDLIILGIVGGILTAILGRSGSGLDFLLGLGYAGYFESSEYQATPGKMAMGIKVTDLDGNRISPGRAIGRYFAKILSWITLTIGFIMAGFTEKKQALHDMIASTLVVVK